MTIGALASGGGSNLQSIINACERGDLNARVAVVISNNSGSGSLVRAEKHGIPHYHASSRTCPDPVKLDGKILSILTDHQVEWVVLAGYMKKMGTRTLTHFENRVVNIHPALLPAFGGKGMYGIRVQQAVIDAGVFESGATVHLVNGQYDEGPILAQESIGVNPDDDPETLQQRVLEIEHRLYPKTLGELDTGIISIAENNQNVVIRPLRVARDFDIAAATVRRTFATVAAKFNLTRGNCPTHPSFVDAERLLKLLDSEGVFFGAFSSNTMIGTVAIEPSKDDPGIWYIEKLAVLPENRTTGFGTLLLEHACNAITNYGGTAASVGIIDEDTQLKSWYVKRGFTVKGTKSFSHLPFTVCFMRRELEVM